MKFKDFEIQDFDNVIKTTFDQNWYENISTDFKKYVSFDKETKKIFINGVNYSLHDYLIDIDDVFSIDNIPLVSFDLERNLFESENGKIIKFIDTNDISNALHKHLTFYKFIQKFKRALENAEHLLTEPRQKARLKTFLIGKANELNSFVSEKQYLEPLIKEIYKIVELRFRDISGIEILDILDGNVKRKTHKEVFNALSTNKFEFSTSLVNYIEPTNFSGKEDLLYSIFFNSDSELAAISARFYIYESKTSFYKFLYSIEEIFTIPNLKSLDRFVLIEDSPFNLNSYRKQKSLFKSNKVSPIASILSLKEHM